MTEDEIKCYLADSTDLSDDLLAEAACRIYSRLDYSGMYEQIDLLVELMYGRERICPASAGE